MKNNYDAQILFQAIQLMNPSIVVPFIENEIKADQIALQANQILHNDAECLKIRHRIADAELLLLIIRRNPPS
jgi:hypothetical protein